MTQLSTDSLAYSQIISSVQKFVSSYMQNNNVSPKDFDKAYQELLAEVRKSIGGPTAVLDLLNKGEVPSSVRFNKFVTQLSEDINAITHQLESLTANYINSFNILNEEIESEKSSIDRIRSKIGALELYSGSNSNNITYFGDLLNNMDLIDVSKSKDVTKCDVTDGIATLPRKGVAKWKARASVYNQNYNNFNLDQNTSPFGLSNGLPGCNFLFTQENLNSIVNPFLFQKDNLTVKSDPSKMVDESPISFFEYEAISIPNVDQKALDDLTTTPEPIARAPHEFQYRNGTNFMNWSNFDSTKPLNMTVELTSTKSAGEYINYISIIPFFGYDTEGMNAQIKNIKVTSIILYDSITTNRSYQVINEGPVYIGSDISGANINNYKKYSYNKGIFRFPETLANKVYITFEQESFNDVRVKHAYWTPYSETNFQNNTTTSPTWHNQSRFNPVESVLPPGTIADSINWNRSLIVPSIDAPNDIKSKSTDAVKINLTYATGTQAPNNVLKLSKSASEQSYYHSRETFNGTVYYIFRQSPSVNLTSEIIDSIKTTMQNTPETSACVFLQPNEFLQNIKIDISTISISGAFPDQTITVSTSEPHGFAVNQLVHLSGSAGQGASAAAFNRVYTVSSVISTSSFTVTHSQGDPLALLSPAAVAVNVNCFPVYARANPDALVSSLETRTVSRNTSEQLWLKRNFETLNAKRASIGIRDIFLGKETYVEKAEIISKPYFIYDEIDLLSLEVSDLIPASSDSLLSIDYYISVDDGLTWIQISPTQRNFVGVPEIIAFNQNISNNAMLPQIAYYNYPEVPNPIKSVRFRAVMKKDRNSNATPILGSYKLAIRFRQ
jgi:hypothetical protein